MYNYTITKKGDYMEENTKIEGYKKVISTAKYLFTDIFYDISILSNASALIFENIDKLNWAGFYIYKDENLLLGPFQGKVACTCIKLGKGVCGTSALQKKAIVVPDVHKFAGHIACDSASNSEIVIPIIIKEKLYGVLDIDSYEFSTFNDIDLKYLTEFVEILTRHLEIALDK